MTHYSGEKCGQFDDQVLVHCEYRLTYREKMIFSKVYSIVLPMEVSLTNICQVQNTEDVERIEYDHLCQEENNLVCKKGAYLTSLILMGYGINFCQALANADFHYLDANIADKCGGFGKSGKVNRFIVSRSVPFSCFRVALLALLIYVFSFGLL